MSTITLSYMNEISKVFAIGVDVLNGSRSLKNISLDLKLLAINGIVQAAKIGTNQGQSLITLSGFLSELPVQIAPELEELEQISSQFARQLTICSIAVRRYLNYSASLRNLIARVLKKTRSAYIADDFNLLDPKVLSKLGNHPAFKNVSQYDKENIVRFANRNKQVIELINNLLYDAHTLMVKASKKLDSIKRNGFIANYMGSNILIESSYLSSDQKSFSGLVENIKNIVKVLDEQLLSISENISRGESIISTLIKIKTT